MRGLIYALLHFFNPILQNRAHQIKHSLQFTCKVLKHEQPVFPNEKLHLYTSVYRGHGGTLVTHSPPTSEVGGSNPEPYVGKMVVSYQWSAVYST